MTTEDIEIRIKEIKSNIELLEQIRDEQRDYVHYVENIVTGCKNRIRLQEIELEKYDEMRKQNMDL